MMRATRLSVPELCQRALWWATWAALLCGVAFAAAVVLYQLVVHGSPRWSEIPGRFLVSAILSFVVLVLGRMLWLSRELQDRAFVYVGFLATFSGLGMLVIFFAQISLDVAAWFRVTPRLVHIQNGIFRENLHKVESALQRLQIELDRDQQAALAPTPGLAEFYRQHIAGKWADLVAEAEKNRKAEFDRRWKEAEGDARQRYALAELRIQLVQKLVKDKYLVLTKKKESDYPAALDDAIYYALEPMIMSVQPVVQKRHEAQVGMRGNTSPPELLEAFITSYPSNLAQDAGIWPALLGSLWLAFITILVAVPIGVGAALYLEEYKQGGWLGYIIQVNINNLAGIPSVVYGILGAFVFVEMIFKPIHLYQAQLIAQATSDGMPFWDRMLLGLPPMAARNVLGGGLTLGLLTLPIIIVASQEAIRAVPSSIRAGAYALGATQWQTIWHQVLPLARPGILTGTILSISRAIGEAAPLVLFGALLLVQREPTPFSGFTVMPMQIFGWADRAPEVYPPPFEEKQRILAHHAASTIGLLASPGGLGPVLASSSGTVTSQLPAETVEIWRYNAAFASLVLLLVLLTLNGFAIWLRNRAQKRIRV